MLCPCSEQSEANKPQLLPSDCEDVPNLHIATLAPELLEICKLQMQRPSTWQPSLLPRAGTHGWDTSRHLGQLPINQFGSASSTTALSCTVLEHSCTVSGLKIVLIVRHCLPQPIDLGLRYIRKLSTSGVDVPWSINRNFLNIPSPLVFPLLHTWWKQIKFQAFAGTFKEAGQCMNDKPHVDRTQERKWVHIWKLNDHTAQVDSPGTETHTVTLAYKKTSLKKIQIAEVSRTSDANRGDGSRWPYMSTGSGWPCLIRGSWTRWPLEIPYNLNHSDSPILSKTQTRCPKHWRLGNH